MDLIDLAIKATYVFQALGVIGVVVGLGMYAVVTSDRPPS